MIVDCAVYAEGHRLDRPKRVGGVRAEAADAAGFAWVGLVEPSAEEFTAISSAAWAAATLWRK